MLLTNNYKLQLESLRRRQLEINQSIAWTRFALRAPEQFVNDKVQEYRKNTLVSLLKELEEITSEIFNVNMRLDDAVILAQSIATKRILKSMGIAHRSEKGIFFIAQ